MASHTRQSLQSDTTFDDIDHEEDLEIRADTLISEFTRKGDLDIQRTNPWGYLGYRPLSQE